MQGGMQAGMQPRIDMWILGCMHPGMPSVIKCRPACSSAWWDACRAACRSACSPACIPNNPRTYFYENCPTRAACPRNAPRHAGGGACRPSGTLA